MLHVNIASIYTKTEAFILINNVKYTFPFNSDATFPVKKGDVITIDYGWSTVLNYLYFS